MIINVKFFGLLRERLGHSDIQLSVPIGSTVGLLKGQLQEMGGRWQRLQEQQVLTALNHKMVQEQAELSDQDEVAFFPPVTGG